ncbi:MAG: imidazolonepropionase [Bacteroidota bacterium]
MKSILIRNIKSLVGIRERPVVLIKGPAMKILPSIEDAFLLIEDGLVKSFGKNNEAPDRADEIINATGKFVMPCWCDSHTHVVYPSSREQEFTDRIKGLSYEEIAKRGGGILNSSNLLKDVSEEILFEGAWERLEEMKTMGTGAVEIKSGYGLSYEGEMKMLRVIRKLKEKSSLTIKATFLGAHAYPTEYKTNHEGYISLLVEKLLPEISSEGLADFIDVFCEKGYFSAAETDRILEAGVKYGLQPKVHVNQFNIIGGVQVSLKHNALSVDHLENVSEEDIKSLLASPTMPVSLPGCSFFLNIPYTPARKMIDAGLPLALATDFNPGSAPSGNMNLVVSLACIKMKMTPEEAINAATLNGAYAMNVADQLGSIAVGKQAKIFITKPMPSLSFLPYSMGNNLVEVCIN